VAYLVGHAGPLVVYGEGLHGVERFAHVLRIWGFPEGVRVLRVGIGGMTSGGGEV
jgi:hypothetical protein